MGPGKTDSSLDQEEGHGFLGFHLQVQGLGLGFGSAFGLGLGHSDSSQCMACNSDLCYAENCECGATTTLGDAEQRPGPLQEGQRAALQWLLGCVV